MQQTYLNAFTHVHQFEGRATFSTWLWRIVIHETLGRRRERPTESQTNETGEGPHLAHAIRGTESRTPSLRLRAETPRRGLGGRAARFLSSGVHAARD